MIKKLSLVLAAAVLAAPAFASGSQGAMPETAAAGEGAMPRTAPGAAPTVAPEALEVKSAIPGPVGSAGQAKTAEGPAGAASVPAEATLEELVGKLTSDKGRAAESRNATIGAAMDHAKDHKPAAEVPGAQSTAGSGLTAGAAEPSKPGEQVPAPQAAEGRIQGLKAHVQRFKAHVKETWQKDKGYVYGGLIGALVEIPFIWAIGTQTLIVFGLVGLAMGLLPFAKSGLNGSENAGWLVRGMTAAAKFVVGPGLPALGAIIGAGAGWGLTHFGFSTAMLLAGGLTGLLVPVVSPGWARRLSDKPTFLKALASGAAGAAVALTLPIWIGARLGGYATPKKTP